MTSSHDSAEKFARLFHHYHEALAPDFNCASNSRTESWEDISANERSRLVAAVRLTLLDVTSTAHEPRNEHRNEFAEQREREWGC